jgi:hypothetical protein
MHACMKIPMHSRRPSGCHVHRRPGERNASSWAQGKPSARGTSSIIRSTLSYKLARDNFAGNKSGDGDLSLREKVTCVRMCSVSRVCAAKCLHLNACTYLQVFHACMCTRILIWIHECAYKYTCADAPKHADPYIHTYICMYVCIYIYIYIYIYTCIFKYVLRICTGCLFMAALTQSLYASYANNHVITYKNSIARIHIKLWSMSQRMLIQLTELILTLRVSKSSALRNLVQIMMSSNIFR